TLFTVIQAVDVINQTYADTVIGLDSLFRILAGFGKLPAVVGVLWIAALAAWLVLGRKPGRRTGAAPSQSATARSEKGAAPSQPAAAPSEKGAAPSQPAAPSEKGAAPSQPAAAPGIAGLFRPRTDSSIPQEADAGERRLGKCLLTVWTILLVSGAALVVFMLVDANMAGNGARYGSLGSYLVFNDSWGTFRGYIWKQSVDLYCRLPLLHRIFGFGPDTFGILTTDEIRFDMIQATGQVFDNAHNEYLNLLVTIGPFGTVAYMVFVFGQILHMARKKNLAKHACMAGCCLAAACYSAQALVNLNIPIAAPILWLMLSVGAAVCRQEERPGDQETKVP
ncbi:MAG: O-antigen ligase family protein, partial [Lachnospiraceae bacterium]|nr:O-antigen ligase family protein [Lachnospiraceae bacterium]